MNPFFNNLLTLFLFVILVWNLLVALGYGYDKWQARRNGWRVKEKHLLWATLLLGGIGAFIGLFLFRHKVRKPLFQLATFFSLIICILLISLIARYLIL